MQTIPLPIWILCASMTCGGLLAEDPQPGPDSRPQDGVAKGELIKGEFASSKVFPGTWREYWVYRPAGYDASKPSPVMVFQDGLQYNAPVVFDNLISRKEIPSLVGVFVMHGRVRAASTNALDRFNRSYEYDGLGDGYARFVVEELLPELERRHGLNLSKDPNDRAIAGNSSGAICAFTAAWERPDYFRRVFSAIGTYVGLRGGNDYPTLIRKTEAKPIRIFLQDGSGDLNIYGGNWWIANQDMLSALAFAGYDVRHEWGDGGHSSKHASAIFPEALRWLWRDYPEPIRAQFRVAERDATGRIPSPPVTQILIEDEPWELVSEAHGFTEGPAVNAQGEVFFTDIPNNRIHRVDLDGKVSVFAENTGGANGLMFGPDGYLYACANGQRSIVRYDSTGAVEEIVPETTCNDLVVLPAGGYYTDPRNRQVWYVDDYGTRRLVDEGINFPNGILVSPDQSLLFVADMRGQFVYSFQIQPDGSLAHKQRYFYMHLRDGTTESGADGMTVDTEGRLYVATDLGIQVFDQAGRVNAILSKPQSAWLSNVAFGGPSLDELYATCGDKVFKRKTKAKGVLPWKPAIKPAAPRL